MQLTALKRELGKSRWVMDIAVCWLAATGFYLYIKWMTRMFETTPPDPRRLLTDMLVIAFGYVCGVLLGRMVLREDKSSLVWIAGVGSAIVGIIMFLTRSLPGEIEYHNRFYPDTSLTLDLIRDFVLIFLGIVLPLAVVTMIAGLVARVVRWLFKPSLERL